MAMGNGPIIEAALIAATAPSTTKLVTKTMGIKLVASTYL
jgi:hypothetical protein